MKVNFCKEIENEILPIINKIGARITIKTPTQLSFDFLEVEISFYLENEFELYAVVSDKNSAQSVYLSELMLYFFKSNEMSVFQISDNDSLHLGIKILANILTGKIIPILEDRRISEVMSIVMQARNDNLRLYNESLIEKDAIKAFSEKRYEDVISIYSKLVELNSNQKKRMNISILKKSK